MFVNRDLIIYLYGRSYGPETDFSIEIFLFVGMVGINMRSTILSEDTEEPLCIRILQRNLRLEGMASSHVRR